MVSRIENSNVGFQAYSSLFHNTYRPFAAMATVEISYLTFSVNRFKFEFSG